MRTTILVLSYARVIVAVAFLLPTMASMVACGGSVASNETIVEEPPTPNETTPLDDAGTATDLVRRNVRVVGEDNNCVALSSAENVAFVADPAPMNQLQDTTIITTAGRMVGEWVGHANSPGGWVPESWYVRFRFDSNSPNGGAYAASSIDTDITPALYYGTDRATELKQWRLLHASAFDVSGEIDVAFDYGDQFGLPAWQGELERIELDSSANRLRFQFRTDDGYGPVKYELWRTCEAHLSTTYRVAGAVVERHRAYPHTNRELCDASEWTRTLTESDVNETEKIAWVS